MSKHIKNGKPFKTLIRAHHNEATNSITWKHGFYSVNGEERLFDNWLERDSELYLHKCSVAANKRKYGRLSRIRNFLRKSWSYTVNGVVSSIANAVTGFKAIIARHA
jgi:hypothetical protein